MISGIFPKMSPPNLYTSSSFPPLLNPDGSTALLSLKLNSFLKHSVITPPWTILGIFLLLISPSGSFMLVIKILPHEIFYALSGFNPKKAYRHDGVPPIVLKNCASVLTPCLVKLLRLCLSNPPFLLAGSMPTYCLCLGSVTALIPQTNGL